MSTPSPRSARDPQSPTADPPPPGGFGSMLGRNIRALEERRREAHARTGLQNQIAEAVTRFCGSMAFVYLHGVVVLGWIAVNRGWLPVVPRFDDSFVILATAASVEAIFLSTYVLISQNRSAAAADAGADLDLQINPLSEHEVTRLPTLTTAIAEHLGLAEAQDPRLDELKQHVALEKVLDEMKQEQG